MNQTLLWLTFAAPLALAALAAVRAARPQVQLLTPWAPLPALLLAATAAEPFTIEVPGMLLGSRLGLDPTARVFLGFTAVLWLAAGVYARAYLADDPARSRFVFFHLLTLAGNLGAIVSHDMASFVLFFTLMSFSAYGLITHDRRESSLQAGRVYLVLTVLGEVLVFWGMVLAAHASQSWYFDGLAERLALSPLRSTIAALILMGFGIKLGIMPLHIWLPLAHPAAPTPASAVLSGAMIKMGLLGMLRLLPLGAVALNEWGAVCLAVGTASTFAAAFFGMTQSNPKTVLAYSSISQMGLATVGVGAALMAPEAWETILASLLLFAVHHALAKASLFLGVGVAACEMPSARTRYLVMIGLIVAALALAGLPLTAGFAAKAALKEVAATAPKAWADALKVLLPLTSITTTLLVSRFLWLVGRQPGHGPWQLGLILPWAVLTSAVVVVFFVLRWFEIVMPEWTRLEPASLWSGVWSILAAAVVVALVMLWPGLARLLQRLQIPEGDLAIPLAAASARLGSAWRHVAVVRLSEVTNAVQQSLSTSTGSAATRLLDYLSCLLENDLATGLLIALIVVTMLALWIW